jgi:hypothetical protein
MGLVIFTVCCCCCCWNCRRNHSANSLLYLLDSGRISGVQMVHTLSSRSLSTSWQVATVFLPRDCQVPDQSPCVPFGTSILIHQRDTHLKIKLNHPKLRNFSQCVQTPQWDIWITNSKHNCLGLRDIWYPFSKLLEDAISTNVMTLTPTQLSTHFHLVPRSDVVELYIHSIIRLHGIKLISQAKGSLYLDVVEIRIIATYLNSKRNERTTTRHIPYGSLLPFWLCLQLDLLGWMGEQRRGSIH